MDSKMLGFDRFFRAYGNSKTFEKVLYKLSCLRNAPKTFFKDSENK